MPIDAAAMRAKSQARMKGLRYEIAPDAGLPLEVA
jgi:hypothetical protein